MISYTFIAILILITCILLGLIVLVQNSKGGGLVSNFQSSNQAMGVRQTADFLEKATWTLAIVLLAFSLLSVFIIPRASEAVPQSEVRELVRDQGVVDFTPAPIQETESETQ